MQYPYTHETIRLDTPTAPLAYPSDTPSRLALIGELLRDLATDPRLAVPVAAVLILGGLIKLLSVFWYGGYAAALLAATVIVIAVLTTRE